MSSLVLDACSMINLSKADALEVVFSLQKHEFSVGEQVVDECDGRIAVLNTAIVSGSIARLDDSQIPVSHFLALKDEHGLGDGETECLMYAVDDPQLVVCTDDGAARRVTATVIGAARVIGSIRLLLDCVEEGLLTSASAFAMYQTMVMRGAFLPALSAADFE